MLLAYKNGQTSVVLRVVLRDSSVTTGAGLTGLAYNTSGLKIATIADNEATATVYSVAGSTIETIATLGTFATPTSTKCRFREVDATNMPGVYEIQLDNARFAVSSAKSLIVSISGASNLAQTNVLIPLQLQDPYTAKLAVTLASTDVTGNLPADLQTIKTQTVTCAAGVTVSAYVGTSAASTAQTGDSYARIGAAGAGLTAIGDTRLANLDAAVSSRSTYAGSDTSGTTTLLARLTSTRAGLLDNLDAAISTRLASTDKTGFKLASDGIDAIVIEVGLNARQAISIIAAESAGVLAGAAGNTITFTGAGVATNRITATVDTTGNRTSQTLNPPA